MTWYGKGGSKELDIILEKKPKLHQLLLYPDFISELKAYNTKLLEYLSNNPAIFRQAVQYLTISPKDSDSDDRKYKLPLVTIEMIETQTTCILNTFFKQSQQPELLYFDTIFTGLDKTQILSLLAGYIFRLSLCLLNNRQKDIIDRMYRNTSIFIKLIDHSNLMAIANILQLFLNLDINKHQSTGNSEERLKIKIQVLNRIISKIQTELLTKKQKSPNIIQNLCGVLCQTIEKYYLIIDGKQLMEIITSQKTISIIMSLIRSPNSDYAFSGFNFCISLINYYSFSSFNVDDVTTQSGQKTLERLQNQPLICQLSAFFSTALERVMRSPSITLYLYHLLQVLCHCISISSFKIFQCIRKTKFFSCLIKLLFANEKNNIVHKLIEKSFLHIFISDRKIYSQYKNHLFCQLDIIDCTAGNFLKTFSDETMFQQAKKKAYFGHFMRILKIYSGIETKDQNIVAAIRGKSDLWNRVSKNLIGPYQALSEKKLGTYDEAPEPIYQQFQVTKTSDVNQKLIQNTSTIQQIKKEESVATVFPTPSPTPPTNQPKLTIDPEKSVPQLFSGPQSPQNHNNSRSPVPNSIKPRQPSYMSQSNVVDYRTQDKQLKKAQSFKEFMDKKKVEAEQQIKIKRSLSQQRKLSGSKKKMASPSPSKKNSWREQASQDNSNNLDKDKKIVPKIPLNRKSIIQSTVSQRKFREDQSFDNYSTKSLVNIEQLRKIKVYKIEKPVQKKYRRIQDKDKILLEFLGLPV